MPNKGVSKVTQIDKPMANILEDEGRDNYYNFVGPIWDLVVNKYDSLKYSDTIYHNLIEKFSSNDISEDDINDAIRWKYGKVGQERIPDSHQKIIESFCPLIEELESLRALKVEDAFEKLDSYHQASLVTKVFFTHLVFPNNVPIIDVHNHRAARYFIKEYSHSEELKRQFKNKNLASSSKLILSQSFALKKLIDETMELFGKPYKEVDMFFMMFGKLLAPRD